MFLTSYTVSHRSYSLSVLYNLLASHYLTPSPTSYSIITIWRRPWGFFSVALSFWAIVTEYVKKCVILH